MGVGDFSSPQVASTFLAQGVKKEFFFFFGQEVDLIFKSADGNMAHVFQAKDIPPWSVLWSLLPLASFSETSSIDRISLRSKTGIRCRFGAAGSKLYLTLT